MANLLLLFLYLEVFIYPLFILDHSKKIGSFLKSSKIRKG